MYWGGSGHSPIGGTMLKNIFSIFLLSFSLNAFACWKGEGTLAVDGESWKLNQKIEHNKEYVFPMGTFILKILVKPGKTQTLVYEVQEKKGINLTLVTKGEEEEIKVGETKEIYAKGEEGQPNSIITIKLTNI